MHSLRIFSIIAWIAIPTVMYGGYALPGMLTRGGLSEFQRTFFRAGHAHAGVLLLMSLLYHYYMEQTNLSPSIKLVSAVLVLVGILAQSGGFFLHMAIGQSGAPSLGTTITSLGGAAFGCINPDISVWLDHDQVKPSHAHNSRQLQGAGLAMELGLDTRIPLNHGGDAYLADPSSNWKVYDSVDLTTNVGYFPSLEVDLNGMVHISYFDKANSALKYAYGHFDEWSVSLVDDSAGVGMHSSLILDSQNNPSIAYTAGKLIYFITGQHR